LKIGPLLRGTVTKSVNGVLLLCDSGKLPVFIGVLLGFKFLQHRSKAVYDLERQQ